MGTSNFWRGKQKLTAAFTVTTTTKDDQSTCVAVEAAYKSVLLFFVYLIGEEDPSAVL